MRQMRRFIHNSRFLTLGASAALIVSALLCAGCHNGEAGSDDADYSKQVFWRVRVKRLSPGYDTGAGAARRFSAASFASLSEALDSAAAWTVSSSDAPEGTSLKGEVFLPKGEYQAGELVFASGVSLALEEGAVLKGAALIADGVNDFSISGLGILDDCTIRISGSDGILLDGVWLRGGSLSISSSKDIQILHARLPLSLDIDGCDNTRIIGCTFDTEESVASLKAATNSSLYIEDITGTAL